jgi:hypothetical protein
MPKKPEDDVPQNVMGLSTTIEHKAGGVPADASPPRTVVHFLPVSVQKRLEVLDTLSRDLREQLSSSDEKLAIRLATMTDELIGLRQDMADLFKEFKDGDMATAVASYTTEVQVAEQNRQDTDARLNRLEERDEKDTEIGSQGAA